MTEPPTTPPPGDDDAILLAMLAQAERLCATSDVLLKGQYEHLYARIDALIELRRPASAIHGATAA